MAKQTKTTSKVVANTTIGGTPAIAAASLVGKVVAPQVKKIDEELLQAAGDVQAEQVVAVDAAPASVGFELAQAAGAAAGSTGAAAGAGAGAAGMSIGTIAAIGAGVAVAANASKSSSSTTAATTTTTTTPAAVAGQTFTLTKGVDQGAAFKGTAGADTFVADNTVDVVLSTADVLDGGDGEDTLNVYSSAANQTVNLAKLTSIETLNIHDQNVSQSIAGVNFDSVKTANLVRGDGALTLTGGSNIQTMGVIDTVVTGDQADAGVVLAFEAARTTATVNLDGVTAAGAGADADENVDVNGAALTSVTVNASGKASSFDTLDVASATTINLNAAAKLTVTALETGATAATLNISGAGAVSLGTLDTAIDTVTATANTGGLTALIGSQVDTVLTGSSGNDTITAGTTDALVAADKLAVDAGAGTGDLLIVAATADIDTAADGARYKNFEIIQTGDSLDMSLVSGVTALQITGGTSEVYSKLSAVQASDVTFVGNNTTSSVFALTNATGASDAITFKLASTTTTTNVDVVGIDVDGFEVVNINATTGTNGTDSDFGFLANKADGVKAINISGSADVKLNVVADTLDVVAVAIDASALSGTGNFTLALTNGLVAGSTVKGSANADAMTLGSVLGTSFDSGAGNDTFTGALALLVADGVDDTKINGGLGTDKLTLSDVTTTLTDNHFTNLSGMEELALTNTTGDASITIGAGFNAAFAAGATITTGTMAATKDITFTGGLATVGIKLTVDATSKVMTAAEIDSITTGSGNDDITFTGDDTTVGVTGAAAQGQIIISTGAGDDKISVTVGTLLANSDGTDSAIVITGGTGKDLITKVGVNGDAINGNAVFVTASGDSTATNYDVITGFDIAEAATFSDTLDFTGTAKTGTLATSVDNASILSHSVTAGFATFDDAAVYNTALVINATNLADVVGYLAANTATNDVIAFAFDSDSNGTADASMVYHNGAVDSLVLLAGVTGTLTVVETNASDAGKLFIA